MRRGKGEWESENRETKIRPLQPSLQPPRLVYPRIDWSKPKTATTRPIYVPPLPEEREEFERINYMYINDGR